MTIIPTYRGPDYTVNHYDGNEYPVRILRAAENHIRAPVAAMEYGKQLPLLSEVHPYFEFTPLSKANRELLPSVRPVWTGDYVAFSKLPLCETIQKEKINGNTRYFLVHSPDGENAWRMQIPRRFLKNDAYKRSMQMFTVANGVRTYGDGQDNFTSLVGEQNDMRVFTCKEKQAEKDCLGGNSLLMYKLPLSLNTAYLNKILPLEPYLLKDIFLEHSLLDSDVAINLIGTGFPAFGEGGHCTYNIKNNGIGLSDWSNTSGGVLVYDEEGSGRIWQPPNRIQQEQAWDELKESAGEARKAAKRLEPTANARLLESITDFISKVEQPSYGREIILKTDFERLSELRELMKKTLQSLSGLRAASNDRALQPIQDFLNAVETAYKTEY